MPHDHNEPELASIVGTALATKLTNDTDRSTSDFKLAVANIIKSSCETRSSLAKDELQHLTEAQREAALGMLEERMRENVLCSLLCLTSAISLSDGDMMSTFVGHAARHFEQEVHNIAFATINRASHSREAQNIQDAAACSTGKNN